MNTVIDIILSFGGTFFTLLFFILLYYGVNFLLSRQGRGKTDWPLIRQITLFLIVLVGLIAVILALPMGDSLRGQITSLIGVVISAVFALSSATFIGNMLAGILLRAIDNFRVGDFIEIHDDYGRVSERGLFHTEIQTINRNLITLPNLYLATNPVKVTRSSGTFISAAVSLGYDVNRLKIENCLKESALKADLKDPFVLITELGDFSIVYEVHGLLEDVKRVLTARSSLYGHMIDTLHNANIEIVSPNFMNQRQVGDAVFIPKKERVKVEETSSEAPEALIFDKADKAVSIENRKEKLEEIEAKLKILKEEFTAAKDDEEKKAEIQIRIDRWLTVKEKLVSKLDDKIEEMKKDT